MRYKAQNKAVCQITNTYLCVIAGSLIATFHSLSLERVQNKVACQIRSHSASCPLHQPQHSIVGVNILGVIQKKGSCVKWFSLIAYTVFACPIITTIHSLGTLVAKCQQPGVCYIFFNECFTFNGTIVTCKKNITNTDSMYFFEKLKLIL